MGTAPRLLSLDRVGLLDLRNRATHSQRLVDRLLQLLALHRHKIEGK
jgi:hypothetical protein